ncbi:unnamed protein product [Brassica rapa subsp. trilocularis]
MDDIRASNSECKGLNLQRSYSLPTTRQQKLGGAASYSNDNEDKA